MLKLFFDASYASKAKKVISGIELDGDLKKVYFKDIKHPMYYPANAPASSLERVICESFYQSNWHYYEIPQTRVDPGDVVIDCGAAEGLFSLLVANRCKKVFAIEPLENFSHCLKRTFADFHNVEVLKLGVSSQEGIATISENDISSSLTLGSGQIKVSTLDKLFFDKGQQVNYIKIDVEGFDVETLRGATEIIRCYKPKIAVAAYHDFSHAAEIKKLLLSIVPEYKIYTKGIYQETGSPVMLHAWIG